MNTIRIAVLAATTAAFFTLAGCASSKPEPRTHENRFDLDGDGYLTPDEYAASALSDVLEFDALDVDGDGLLSPRELELRSGSRSRGRGPRGAQRPERG